MRHKRTEGRIWQAQHKRTEEGDAFLRKLEEAKRTPRGLEQVVRSREEA